MDDTELWKKYIKSVTPMKGARQDFLSLPSLLNNAVSNTSFNNSSSSLNRFIDTQEKNVKNYQENHVKKAEKNLSKSMRRGEFAFDAKIDLHGYSQDQAYDALHNFIEKNYFSQKRHLLIITGKGKFCYQTYQNMGILKPKLPEWFYDSHFAKYVSVYQKAAPKDGGSGAYYIILRKKT